MSVAWLERVFRYSRARGAAYTVALGLAERADDAGCCWPGLADIAWRARLTTERAARRALAELVRLGELRIEPGGGRGKTNRYELNIAAQETRTGAQGFPATENPDNGAETPARGARKPLRAAPENPDRRAGGTNREPSENQQQQPAGGRSAGKGAVAAADSDRAAVVMRLLTAEGVQEPMLGRLAADPNVTSDLVRAAVLWTDGKPRVDNPPGMIVDALRKHRAELELVVRASQAEAADLQRRRAEAGQLAAARQLVAAMGDADYDTCTVEACKRLRGASRPKPEAEYKLCRQSRALLPPDYVATLAAVYRERASSRAAEGGNGETSGRTPSGSAPGSTDRAAGRAGGCGKRAQNLRSGQLDKGATVSNTY